MGCRLRCAGIYSENEKILLVKHRKKQREYYLLPGGGREKDETLLETLKREWKEELNLDIEVGDILFIGESFAANKSERNRNVTQVVFSIKKISGEIKVEQDGTLFAYEWIDISKLKEIPLFPNATEQILECLQSGASSKKYFLYDWIP